jgi:hypothetical protein
VLVVLHGAGLEADSERVRHMLDASPELCAWLLFPSGVTSWSGDDWRGLITSPSLSFALITRQTTGALKTFKGQ